MCADECESIPPYSHLQRSSPSDIRMLPTLTICLMINYLDRSNVTNARVAGMQEDMNMTDVQWVSRSHRPSVSLSH